MVFTLDSISRLKYELSQLYLVGPNKSNTVVADPYHIVDDDIIPGMKMAVRELDKTDSMFNILNNVKIVGPGRDSRCHKLAPNPKIPDDR